MLILAANHNKRKEEQLKKRITLAGVGSSLSFPRKSADSQTGPTTSKVETSALGDAGETSSMCWNQTQNKSTPSQKENNSVMTFKWGKRKKEGSLVTRNSSQKGDDTDKYSNMKAWGNPNFFTLIRYYIDL